MDLLLNSRQKLTFLTERADLPLVREVAKEMKFRTSGDPNCPGGIVCEVNRRFNVSIWPITSLGFTTEELIRVPDSETVLPCELYTVSVPAACTGYLRRVANWRYADAWLWMHTALQVDELLGASMPLSYECIPPPRTRRPPPLTESEKIESDNALKQLDTWTFRSGEGWMKEMITMMISRVQLSLPFVEPGAK